MNPNSLSLVNMVVSPSNHVSHSRSERSAFSLDSEGLPEEGHVERPPQYLHKNSRNVPKHQRHVGGGRFVQSPEV